MAISTATAATNMAPAPCTRPGVDENGTSRPRNERAYQAAKNRSSGLLAMCVISPKWMNGVILPRLAKVEERYAVSRHCRPGAALHRVGPSGKAALASYLSSFFKVFIFFIFFRDLFVFFPVVITKNSDSQG